MKKLVALIFAVALTSVRPLLAQGEGPGDGGGGVQRCWNCASETVNGLTYSYCQYGSLVGKAGCTSGGVNGQTVCTLSESSCPSTELNIESMLAAGMISTAGTVAQPFRVVSTESARGSPSSLIDGESFGIVRNCQGLVASFSVFAAKIAVGSLVHPITTIYP